MPNRHRKLKHPEPQPAPQRHLRVVKHHETPLSAEKPTSESAPKRKLKTNRIVAAVFFTLVVVASIFTRPTRPILPSNPYIENLIQLEQELQSGGVTAFFGAKESLKRSIGTTLVENSNPQKLKAAQQVATYLFPELLSDSNFEKEQAEAYWSPLMKAIERSPGNKESIRWFQELESNLYNYESPSRETPQLSLYTRQILRIYQKLAEGAGR